jgi:hypothetical protein
LKGLGNALFIVVFFVETVGQVLVVLFFSAFTSLRGIGILIYAVCHVYSFEGDAFPSVVTGWSM